LTRLDGLPFSPLTPHRLPLLSHSSHLLNLFDVRCRLRHFARRISDIYRHISNLLRHRFVAGGRFPSITVQNSGDLFGNFFDGFPLSLTHNVSVGFQRRARGGVTELASNNLGRRSRVEQQRRVRMAKRAKSTPGDPERVELSPWTTRSRRRWPTLRDMD
jgi:hypothetical protein